MIISVPRVPTPGASSQRISSRNPKTCCNVMALCLEIQKHFQLKFLGFSKNITFDPMFCEPQIIGIKKYPAEKVTLIKGCTHSYPWASLLILKALFVKGTKLSKTVKNVIFPKCHLFFSIFHLCFQLIQYKIIFMESSVYRNFS